MKKVGVNKFPFHPYFNIACVAIFTAIGIVGFYFLASNIVAVDNIVHLSELKFYLFFVMASVAMIVFQFIRKMRNRLNVVILLISTILYAINIAIRQIFADNFTITMIAYGLSLCATLFIVMAGEFFVLQLASNAIANDSEYFVVSKNDLQMLKGSVVFFVIIVVLIPIMTLTDLNIYEIILWEAIVAVSTIVLSLGNYYSIRKAAIVGRDEYVLEYRSIILYLQASRKQLQEYEHYKKQIETEITHFSDARNKELEQKAEYEAIEASKPILLQEIEALNADIAKYDIAAIKDNMQYAHGRIETIQKQLWHDNYATKYDELVQTIHAAKEQLETTKYELEQTKNKSEEAKQALESIGYKLDDDTEVQDDLKVKFNDLAKKKAAYIDEYENGALEEKEANRLKNKIDKMSVKENDLNSKIVALETKIEQARTQEFNLKQQLHTLVEVDMPDYQYAITTVSEKLTTSEQTKADIEKQFEQMITEHQEFNQMKKQLQNAEEEEKAYNKLVESRRDKQAIVDMDCLGEVAKIDQKIKGIDESINNKNTENATFEEKHQRTNAIIQDFLQNKEKILQKLMK